MEKPETRNGRRKRVGLISSWASREGGGVFEALITQCALVADCGHDPVVFALADAHSEQDRTRFGRVPVATFRVVGPARPGYAPGLIEGLRAARLDLLHLHGIWNYPSHAAARWAALTGMPYVISPHGMLDPWITARGRLKKTIARLGYERRSWRRAACFHALTDAEAQDIAREQPRAESVVIPNFVAFAPALTTERAPSVVYLGRIHPKKNLDGLIEGWRSLSDDERRGHGLTIAGWGDAPDVARFEARLAERRDDSIAFVGPVYGEAKAALLGCAAFVVLPSHSEGLPVAMLESWAAGTPTLMSRHCHLDIGFARGAAIECDTSAASVAAALRQGLALGPQSWEAMSRAAGALVRERFSRGVVLAEWRALYDRLLAGGAAS